MKSPLQKEMKESTQEKPNFLTPFKGPECQQPTIRRAGLKQRSQGDLVTWTCSHILAGPWENDVPKSPKIETLQTLGRGKTAESHSAKCPPWPLQRAFGHCSAGHCSAGRGHSNQTKPNQTNLSLPPSSSFPRPSCRAATPSAV